MRKLLSLYANFLTKIATIFSIMGVKVTKITDVNLLREAASFTSGRDCSMSLANAYRNGHSIIRTQLFKVELTDIPLFVASQLVRQTQGVNWFQRSKRPDRGGKDFAVACHDASRQLEDVAGVVGEIPEEDTMNALDDLSSTVWGWQYQFDRLAPTDLMGVMNAEALMNMAHKRLCSKASTRTQEIVGGKFALRYPRLTPTSPLTWCLSASSVAASVPKVSPAAITATP